MTPNLHADPHGSPPAPYPHPACLDDDALLAQCHFGRSRSSGPGGQHRNKVETEVTLTHNPTGLAGVAGERRSQIENKRVALRRLRLLLASELRGVPPARRGLAVLDEPAGSALWQSRNQRGRIVCNPDHPDFPSLLAEAMDHLAEAGWEPRKAASRLDVTASQLVKLVQDHRHAFEILNRERAKHGLHALK